MSPGKGPVGAATALATSEIWGCCGRWLVVSRLVEALVQIGV